MSLRATVSLPETSAGRFACPSCPERFETVGDKKRHIRDQHPKETR